MKKGVVFTIISIIFIACSSIYARSIELKTGEKIEGEIIKKTSQGIVVKVPYGEISIGWDDLSKAELQRIARKGKKDLSLFPGQEIIVIDEKLYGKDYLYPVLKDTWNLMESLIDKKRGLPFDNSTRQDYTSTSNVGLYLASIYAAQRFGFIIRPEALKIAEKAVTSIEKLRKWHGFPVSWFHLSTLKTTNGIVSPIDSGNIAAGLIALRNAYPELARRCTKLINAMKWRDLYDFEKKELKGGFALKKTRYLDFTFNDLGSDSRMASFIGIATGQIPVQHWDNLNRMLEERYGIQYLGPGWRSGGIFLHGINALFLDERGTILGQSMANAAYAQIIHARNEGYPVWGWSSSSSPGGDYLGMGQLIDRVVTPHASVMTVWYYPRTVVENLKKLEELGVRSTTETADDNYGFWDSIDIENKRIGKKFLFVDQAMIFLSIANYLGNGIIWDIFKKDRLVKAGIDKIDDYQENRFSEIRSLCIKRDNEIEKIEEGAALPIPGALIRPYVVRKEMKTEIPYIENITIDGNFNDWNVVPDLELPLENCMEVGVIVSENDFGITYRFAWDENYLYMFARVIDDQIITKEKKLNKIWKDDCLELFIDPQNDKLIWGHQWDYQIGFSPPSDRTDPRMWAWFQGKSPEGVDIVYKQFQEGELKGYIIEAAIPWKFLGITPEEGVVFGFSPAAHDRDNDKFGETKMNWSFFPGNKIKLGEAKLVK